LGEFGASIVGVAAALGLIVIGFGVGMAVGG